VFVVLAAVTSPCFCLTFAQSALVLAVEDLAEGGAEVGVEDGVDDRVEQTVEVAEPVDDAVNERRQFQTAFGAERTNQSSDEEGKPTADERSSDDGKCPRRFPLSLLFQPLLGASLLHIHAGHKKRATLFSTITLTLLKSDFNNNFYINEKMYEYSTVYEVKT